MKIVKYIFSLFLSSANLLTYTGIQDGQEIPDAIILANTSTETITVNDKEIKPGNEDYIYNHMPSGSLTISSPSHTYEISCPTYDPSQPILEVFTRAYLDFNTIKFLAHGKHTKKGLDQITIINDSLYKIAVIYSLNNKRSQPITIDPQAEASKIVSTYNPQENIGTAFLIDADKKKYSFRFKRRFFSPKNSHTADWRSEKISANTISWFGKGFKILTTSSSHTHPGLPARLPFEALAKYGAPSDKPQKA
jgi:hypothetical protein